MLPPELHLMVLEHVLGEETEKAERDSSCLSVTGWINLSLVCRTWRDRIYSVAYDHLFVNQKYLAKLHRIDSESIIPGWFDLEHIPRSALSFVSTLTLSLPHPVYDLPETLMILESASNLDSLALDICLRSDTAPIEATRKPNLGQVDCFSLRFAYVPDGLYLPWSAKDVQWILSCVSLATHLLLELPRQLCVAGPSCQIPFHFPYAISIQSNEWIEWLLGPGARLPNLRFLEVNGDPSSDNIKLLSQHQTVLESLCLSDVNHGWTNLVPHFRSLKYLGLSYLYNFPWLSVQLPNLLHFEFIWIGEREKNDLHDIAQFLRNNHSIKLVTYHAESKLPFLESPDCAAGITYIWRPRGFHQNWRFIKAGQKHLLYAISYDSWEDAGTYPPISRPLVLPQSSDHIVLC